MRLKAGLVVVVLLLLSFAGVSQRANGQDGATPTPTEILPPLPTDVPLPTETFTLTPSDIATVTNTATLTATDTPTATFSDTATATETPSATTDPYACDLNNTTIEAGRSDCLREVLEAANPNSSNQCAAVTIYLAPNSTYTFSTPDNPRNALPMITCPITIYGQGSVLQRDFATSEYFRFFEIKPNGTLTLDNLTLQNGALPEQNHANIGGAIFVQHGRLTLQNGVRLVGNSAYDGGAIYNAGGTVAISNAIFNANNATQDSAIYADAQATLRVNNSCFLHNSTLQLSYTVGTAGTIDATNNWWDSINGPATVATLNEQSVSAGVSYQPFSTTSPTCDGEPNATATPASTATATFNPTAPATLTLTATPSATATDSATATLTPTLSATPTSTLTPVPATATPMLTPTVPKATMPSTTPVVGLSNCNFVAGSSVYNIGASDELCLIEALELSNPTTCKQNPDTEQNILSQIHLVASDYIFSDDHNTDEKTVKNALPQIKCPVVIYGHEARIIRNNSITTLFRFFFVLSGGNLVLDNVTLENGSVTSGLAGIVGYSGGAIRVDNGTLTINNSTLNDNYARSGGAIAANEATVTIRDSVFEDNDSQYSGGAISASLTNLTIIHTEFLSNGNDSAGNPHTDHGGAIAIDDGRATTAGSTVAIAYSLFDSNQADVISAIYADMTYTTDVDNHSILTIKHTIFQNNSASANKASSGVVYVMDTSLTMTDSIFRDNRDVNMAGLHLGVNATATLNSVDFIRNQTVLLTGLLGESSTGPENSAIYVETFPQFADYPVKIRNGCFVANKMSPTEVGYTVESARPTAVPNSVDARVNWWNSDAGPRTIASTNAQSVNNTVRFTSWLTSAPTCGTVEPFPQCVFNGAGVFLPVMRAPITYNPEVGNLDQSYASGYDFIVHQKFIDHLNVTWYEVTAVVEDGKTENVDSYINQHGPVWLMASFLSQFESTKGENCPSPTDLPISPKYTIPTISWNSFSGSTFATWPLATSSICAASRKQFHALGYSLAGGLNYPHNTHHGVDFFVSDTNPPNVYSMDDGIVVGMGINDNSTKSHGVWGASINNGETPPYGNIGYTVIVRYGHLYVLYGHLAFVSEDVWVGAHVTAGQFIGVQGKFNERHLHLEVHSYGTVTPPFLDVTGILPRNVLNQSSAIEQIPHFGYDVLQFLPNPTGYIPANNNYKSLRQAVATSNLIAVATHMEVDLNLGSCVIKYMTVNPAVTILDEINGYRGFDLYNSVSLPSPFLVPSNFATN